MNTPNQLDKRKNVLPKVSNKKKFFSIGFNKLNRIKNYLDKDFESKFENQNQNQNQNKQSLIKCTKIFPDIISACPNAPKKTNISSFKLSTKELDKIKINLFFENTNYLTPVKEKNIVIPKAPLKKKSRVGSIIYLDDIDDQIQDDNDYNNDYDYDYDDDYDCDDDYDNDYDDESTIDLRSDELRNVKRQLVF
jgi:hypothetical protein